MENVAVNTAVDVKLSHHDMVEMMIDEQVEKLETNCFDLRDQIKKTTEKMNLEKEAIGEYIRSKANIKDKEIERLKKIAKELKLEIVNDIRLIWKSENEPFDKGHKIDFESLGRFAAPMRKYNEIKRHPNLDNADYKIRNHVSRYSYTYVQPNKIEVSFHAYNTGKEGYEDVVLKKRGYTVDAKLDAKAKKMVNSYRKLHRDLRDQELALYDSESRLFELEHSGKRAKSQFLKAMLANSDSGKQLLGMMKTVSKTNLLDAGK